MAFKNQGFEVILASPPEYEALVAEIFFDGKIIAIVNQERGVNQLEIELPGMNLDQTKILRRVELSGFLQAVEAACKRLRGELK